MSLFSARSIRMRKVIDPSKVTIDGELAGTFFAGQIEMKFPNNDYSIDKFRILIGKNANNKICLHDFQIKVDENPFKLQIMEINEADEIFKEEIKEGNLAVFGIGDDSYASIEIPHILQNQVVTISANFELPITFTSDNNIGIFFPLTYPGKSNDQLIKCSDFHFSLNFPSYRLTEASITSNPEGTIDLSASIYHIDHLDPFLTKLSISIDSKSSTFSEEPNSIIDPFFSKDGIATCCGKYGSFTFIPISTNENREYDHSGEEFIFIVDCSGSMSGHEIKLAAQCLTFFIKSLPENCYFNVIRFGSNFIPLFERPVEYNESNVSEALNLAMRLKADLGGTVLSNPLSYVFKTPLSIENKIRRIFVLTDGCVFDRSEVIDLVQLNSNTTMSSSIGIGYSVDHELVKGIGEAGKGLFDFVLSGDDMRSKVINQLSQSLNGLCKIDISIENNESVEILPFLSDYRVSFNNQATFFFKSSKELDDNINISIEIEGNSKPTVIELKKLDSSSSRVKKSLEYLFNNENIRILRGLEQTDEVVAKIIQLSIEYGILTPYTALLGTQEYSSQEEKERIKIKEFQIKVKTLIGRIFEFSVYEDYNAEDIKSLIEDKEGIPIDQQRLIFERSEMTDEKKTLSDYNIHEGSTLHLVLRLRGGGYPIEYPQRNCYSSKADDLISIILEQKINGCWNSIPNFFIKMRLNELILKVQGLCAQQNISDNIQPIVGTLVSLVYMKKYKKECFQMWSLIYKKGIKWLQSNYSKINWERLIHQIMTDRNEEEEEEKQFIQFKENKLIFLLNCNDKSASVIGNDSANGDVIIPRSINCNNHEYIIKSIACNAFKGSKDIISIHFHHDSEIKSIDKDAFVESSIQSIVIPESVSDLKEGWCHGTPKLINVLLAPANKNFIYIDNKMIIGKNDQKSDNYDILMFVRRDIQKITIPSFIKQIGICAFSQSSINEVFIPSQVMKIDKDAFAFCNELKKVEISDDSQLQTIDKSAFEGCTIENKSVPKRFEYLF